MLVAVTARETPLPTGGGDPHPGSIVAKIKAHLVPQLIVTGEKLRFLTFLEEARMVGVALGQHEDAGRGNFKCPSGCRFGDPFAEQAERNFRAGKCDWIAISPDAFPAHATARPRVEKSVSRPSRSPNLEASRFFAYGFEASCVMRLAMPYERDVGSKIREIAGRWHTRSELPTVPLQQQQNLIGAERAVDIQLKRLGRDEKVVDWDRSSEVARAIV